MGVADRDYEYKESFRRKHFTLGQKGNALVGLVTINIVVFLFILTANLFNLYSNQGKGMEVLDYNAVNWFALPASVDALLHKPWAMLTFMFAHGGGAEVFPMLLNMLSSMLWLWLFGLILQDLSGNKYIFPVYIYGSILGGILFMIVAHAVPALQGVLPSYLLFGSGMGSVAIAAAVTTINPDYRIFRNIRNGMPIWILSAIFLLINILGIFSANTAYSFAYLGAALAGFLFVYFLKRGTDTGAWMVSAYEWAGNIFTPQKKAKIVSVKEKVFYNTGNREPYKKTPIITQKRVDEILDKINQRGYDLLTEEEKTILKKAAEADNF